MSRTVQSLELVIPGAPYGKGRPKFSTRGGSVRAYTPADTRVHAESIRAAWRAAGGPRLHDGPLISTIVARFARPKSHYRADGVTLSAVGHREPYCLTRFDVDNLEKAALDALNGLAYRDDTLVVDGRTVKAWAIEEPHTLIRIRAIEPCELPVAA